MMVQHVIIAVDIEEQNKNLWARVLNFREKIILEPLDASASDDDIIVRLHVNVPYSSLIFPDCIFNNRVFLIYKTGCLMCDAYSALCVVSMELIHSR